MEIKFLNGKPGIYSARFAGKNCSYEDNVRKVLKLLKNVPLKKRIATFKCAMALCNENQTLAVRIGSCKGHITFQAKGKKGFGYDPIFVPLGYKKTFAELSIHLKYKISHRAKALKKISKVIKKYLKNE